MFKGTDRRRVRSRQTGLITVRASTIVMIGFAVVFGLLAVFIAQVWLNNQASLHAKNNNEPKQTQIASQTVVVAKQPLRFGTELSAPMLQEVPWPSELAAERRLCEN